jgi:hypothetical protein
VQPSETFTTEAFTNAPVAKPKLVGGKMVSGATTGCASRMNTGELTLMRSLPLEPTFPAKSARKIADCGAIVSRLSCTIAVAVPPLSVTLLGMPTHPAVPTQTSPHVEERFTVPANLEAAAPLSVKAWILISKGSCSSTLMLRALLVAVISNVQACSSSWAMHCPHLPQYRPSGQVPWLLHKYEPPGGSGL